MRRICCLFVMFTVLITAAEMGRLRGRIIDEYGEPLVGVNVMVENTELGAATDENGEYVVPFVPIGYHKITASCIGYNTITKENVLVISNQTSVLNYKMSLALITMETIVIKAEKPMVIKTQTQTERTITSRDISSLPISEINQIITLQAGVSTSGLGTHVRGGRATEIVYYVDGILTKAPHYGTQSVKVNKEAVEEIAIATGGFDAEYGEAMSGVVNIVTREGSEKTTTNFRYTTDEIFSTDRLNYGYNLYEMSLGGSALEKKRLKYFVSAEAMLTDCWQSTYYKVPSEKTEYKIGGKMSLRLARAKGKLLLSGFHSREQFMRYDNFGDQAFIFHLDHNTGETLKNNLLNLTLNYMPNKNMIIESKTGYTHMTRFYAVRDCEAEAAADRKWYEDYIFKAHHFPEILLRTDDDSVRKWYLVDSMMNYYQMIERRSAASLRHNPYGATGFYYTVGDNRMWRFLYNKDYQGVLSITNSIGKVHELKSGLSITYQNVGWFDNNLPYYSIPFWDMYDKKPLRLAFYVQDRMDFEGIIARLGLRLDYFDSKARGLANPSDRSDTTLIITKPKLRISPRLGFSLPITDRSKLRFNYGHFSQTPTSHNLYRSTEPTVVWLLLHRYNSVLGNPNLTVEKTVSYELGYENQISEVFVFGFIAYFKDIYDLIQTRRFVSLPYPYYMVTNVDYGNVKGIELTLGKRLRDYWTFNLSYTLQYAKGTASDPWQHYYRIYYAQQIDPITGEFLLPKNDYWLDFDERHIINSNIGLAFPEDFMLVPLREFSSDFIVSYHSGFPYTPRNARGEQIGEANSARLPGYINVDAHVAKDVKIAGVKFTVFTQMYNLFNTEQIVSVYEQTGKPYTNGEEETILLQEFSNISLRSAYYTPQADYNHDGLNSPAELHSEYIAAHVRFYDNPLNWKPGFKMRLGIGLRI